MDAHTARDYFLRDVAIAGLVLIVALLIIALGTFGFPRFREIIYPIGGSLTGAAGGLLSAAFAQRRTANAFHAALEMSRLVNPNIQPIHAQDTKYRHLYWKTVKRARDGHAVGAGWYHCEVQWQQHGDLPFLTGIANVSDVEDEEVAPRRYDHLLMKTRGRVLLLTTNADTNEYTAVHVFWSPIGSETLVGHLRHVTWTGREALSPCILTERTYHQGRRINPQRQAELDDLWSSITKDNIEVQLPGVEGAPVPPAAALRPLDTNLITSGHGDHT
jgi:hypothetical protein